MSKKLSVIIPVYNAEKYIARCIQSLLEQTLQECEFIFVNDGSTDNSKEIIGRFQSLDRRVLLLNKKNEGVSTARNMGLSVATGEYIGFVDADDYIENGMYGILYKCAKEGSYDVLISNFEVEIEGEKVITKYPFLTDITLDKEYIEHNIIPYFLMSDKLNTVCNKIYKRSLINKYNIEFPAAIELGEDGLFNIHFFSNAATAKYIDYTGYHYREVKGSATRNIAEKDYFKRALDTYLMELPDKYVKGIDKDKLQRLKAIKLVNSLISYINIYFSKSEDMRFIKRYKYIKNMILDKYTREALLIYTGEYYNTLGRYEKFIVDMMRAKFMLGLYFAVSYSKARNLQFRRKSA